MTKVSCPDCDQHIAVHEIEARTVTETTGFATNYRCPFCRADFDEIGDNMM
jgi:transposase-like protein